MGQPNQGPGISYLGKISVWHADDGLPALDNMLFDFRR